MKNRTSLFYLLTIILCFGATAMSYGQAVVSVNPSPVASPAAGSTLKVNIQISGASGVAGYELTVEFDTSALTYVSAANGTFLPAGAFAPNPTVSGNRVTLIAAAGSASTKNSGPLATVTFRVAAVKASTLRLQNVVLSNVDGTNLAVQTVNGQVVKSSGAAWDVNQDGQVNVSDLVLVARSLGSSSPANPRVDVNGDGQVNVSDLVLVARHLGDSPDDDGLPREDAPVEVVEDGDEDAESTTLEGMVLIPAGEFQMGSDDEDADPNEQPVHTVYVDAFYMDKYEVTNAQFKKFVDANPEWQKDRIDASFHNGHYLEHWSGNNYPAAKANHPVTRVSWYAAMAYAQWAGKRLPTEAEWEKAARGGLSGQKYPWGNAIDATKANYNRPGAADATTIVGKYPPNQYGLYDMAGNVGEWCLDEYNGGFYAISPAANPIAGASSVSWIIDNFTGINTPRVYRGGTWWTGAWTQRVSKRNDSWTTWATIPSFTDITYGFRCVKDITP